MPAISSLARLCALLAAICGLTVTTLSATPAQALQQREAVAYSPTQVAQADQQDAARRARAAKSLNGRISSALGTALAQRGDWYAYGASGPERFDCSGLLYYSYRRAGFAIPRTSDAQAAHARRIPKRAMRPGDLMFFYGSGGVYHAAIFVRWDRGRALMVDSLRPGTRVAVRAPWTSSWFAGTLR
ncbi:hypothetical protein DDE18_20025 [Nocardioides gansuensis]|uniref:NlpC/P60 domain-containing protein n=1 Tax=Nocardioides gansuensis TaxID=2138300 RepID=A0A2T8F5W8_9ACTN|nr:NlpC/P60 family protein [Nocardioides gansuensis]PVG81099.1 hypothetical protein DDE18_20025 [Nocardioides gansuensis]